MKENYVDKLANLIENHTNIYSFKKYDVKMNLFGIEDIRVWRRRNINTNRAIAVLNLPDGFQLNGNSLGEFSKHIKGQLGKEIGYLTFLYPLGLQLVICGNNIIHLSNNLEEYVDKYDNQQVILQSIHVVDFIEQKSKSARTWGQYVTGKFQDSIQEAIQMFLSQQHEERNAGEQI